MHGYCSGGLGFRVFSAAFFWQSQSMDFMIFDCSGGVSSQVHWMFELLLSARVGLLFFKTEVPSGKRCFLDVTVPRAFGTIRIYFPQFVV